MPGIAGIISRRKSSDDCERLVASMTRNMMHESFYVSGTQAFNELGVYTGWVAHQSSFGAGQVFWDEQREIALLVSGECLIDPEMRDVLKKKGHRFDGNAGDWLVHLYEEKGEGFFGGLNGLFSGLLIDKRENKAFLFNDRYGMERIYWHERRDGVYFASEAKALLRILPELRAFDEQGVAQFLAFGCTLEQRTLFRGIQTLPGASVWSFEDGKCQKRKYFSPTTWESQPILSDEAFEAQFGETFTRIVPRYCDSEHRLGISLTAGLDTRLIMAARPTMRREAICYTYDGVSGNTADAKIAAQVARTCGMPHQVLRIGADFFSEFSTFADRTVFATDGTFGVFGAHEIYLSAKARTQALIRLTGVFGGEIMRGVSTFKSSRLSRGLLSPEMRKLVEREALGLRPTGAKHPVSFAAFSEIPWNSFGSIAACRSQLVFRTPYLDNELVSLAYRASIGLRSSSITALDFVERNNPDLASIPTDMGLGERQGLKGLWRRLSAKTSFKLDYFSNEGFPSKLGLLDDVVNSLNSRQILFGHHKYLRYRSWLRKELAEYLRDALTACDQTPFWNPAFVRDLGEQHIAGRGNHVRDINAVLSLSAVARTLLRAPMSDGQA